MLSKNLEELFSSIIAREIQIALHREYDLPYKDGQLFGL